jgi:GH25 family lysozyme M1 (1,4-beta-N-acetylmuramidase)
LFPESTAPRSPRRALTAAGVLGASLVLAAGATTATATAQPVPSGGNVPLGQGYAGIGYVQDGKAFAPDTRSLDLTPAAVTPAFTANPVPGVDVSHFQGTVNWASVKAAGIKFAWIKDTEGTTYKDPEFSANYTHAYNNGIIRGAYHFAHPDLSSGAAQATYFANNGGGWSKDGLTLPGMLDLEGGCYGKSASAMQSWISDFRSTYKSKTGREIVIYTSASWWNTCTNGWGGLNGKTPLWAASWTSASSPTLPNGFSSSKVWQFTDSGSVSGISGNVDRDRFNGDHDALVAFANNT